jgi:hypothetical protein
MRRLQRRRSTGHMAGSLDDARHRRLLARPRGDGYPGDDQRRRARACDVPLERELSREELHAGACALLSAPRTDVLCRMVMRVALALLLTPGRVTRVPQPDGHKMHGSYINISTWDSQFHECAYKRTTPPTSPSAAAAARTAPCPRHASGTRWSAAPSTSPSYTTACSCSTSRWLRMQT